MIKVGKIKVNSNINPEIFKLLIIFSFLLFLIFVGYIINNLIKTKNYVKVNASIIDIGYESFYDYESNANFYDNYIKVSYTYNHNNYTNKQRVVFRFNKKIGNNIKIYINPKNPIEIRDNYHIRLSIIFSIISVVFNLLCIKAYIVRKNL